MLARVVVVLIFLARDVLLLVRLLIVLLGVLVVLFGVLIVLLVVLIVLLGVLIVLLGVLIVLLGVLVLLLSVLIVLLDVFILIIALLLDTVLWRAIILVEVQKVVLLFAASILVAELLELGSVLVDSHIQLLAVGAESLRRAICSVECTAAAIKFLVNGACVSQVEVVLVFWQRVVVMRFKLDLLARAAA